jgi:dolichol kinase
MILTLGILLGLYGLIIGLAELSFRQGLDSFTVRKAAHICCGLITAILPVFLTLPYTVAVGLLLSSFVFVSKRFKIFRGIEHTDQLSWGTLYFPLGFVLSALLFWNDNPLIFTGSALILGLSDGSAALLGKRFGGKKFRGSSKSYVGTAVFALVTAIICTGVAIAMHGSIANVGVLRLITLIIGSVVVAVVEALSNEGTDNLFVPITAGMLLYILA